MFANVRNKKLRLHHVQNSNGQLTAIAPEDRRIPFVRSRRTIALVLYFFRTVLHFSGTLYLLMFGKHYHRLLSRDNPLTVTRLLRNAYLHHLRTFLAHIFSIDSNHAPLSLQKIWASSIRFHMHFSENQLGQSAPVIGHFCYMFYSRQERPELNQLPYLQAQWPGRVPLPNFRQYLWKLLTKGWTR